MKNVLVWIRNIFVALLIFLVVMFIFSYNSKKSLNKNPIALKPIPTVISIENKNPIEKKEKKEIEPVISIIPTVIPDNNIIPSKIEIHDNTWAATQLSNGKLVKRKDWTNDWIITYSKENDNVTYLNIKSSKRTLKGFIESEYQFLDWEVVEYKKKVSECLEPQYEVYPRRSLIRRIFRR